MDLADELDQAARDGDEAAARQLLAAGARADQPNQHGYLPLHVASYSGHERVVRLPLEAAPATASVADSQGQTALHHAALGFRHCPAAAVVPLLLEAAAELAFVMDVYGCTPLFMVLFFSRHRTAEQVVETARCLVRAAPAVQPALGILLQYSQQSATLFADLVARLPLSREQWHSIPAPCPDLDRALPAVLQRSAAEAGWLVGRLAEGQGKRLRAAALSLARAQQPSRCSLPAEVSGRILAQALAA
ncbi:hypothetical protein CHLNCDRAFT_135922 [Chlorella variabilis]|uniref:Uncharacterized protein n=1 Tax=Chlorella variabilis TaxID=554065 RepID=E1ZJD5_CHLVA|nr:hypothetical protein CHLNCDRAFT_135922 [Chlorella variabilis]EFN53977.1 hypothetical protein CHLNCDRAFT_135922 [Chlorella variabilis]|eukprot:XP_005846079.1 hypothetical protein CHLNCDRAFT_135922 [Chlorella variabilis]